MRNINKYIKEVRQYFPILMKEEKKYLSDFKNRLILYAKNNPDYVYEDLLSHFGNPSDIAKSYLNNQSDEYVLKQLKTRKYIKVTCIIGVLIFMLIGIWKGYLIYDDAKKSIDSKIKYIEITKPEVLE